MTELPDPVRRHWGHVVALKNLADGMAPGPGQVRIQARYEQVLAEHRAWVAGLPSLTK